MIAFLAIIARGVIFHGSITLTFQMATLRLFSFGILGYTIGRIAETVVEDSIRENLFTELKKQCSEDQLT